MKIALLGDSITEGIGSKKINYSSFLYNSFKEKKIDVRIVNFAKTGSMINRYWEVEKNILELNPEYIVIWYGQVEAIYRMSTTKKMYKLLPQRYKGLGMSDPRALYTSRPIKRCVQKIDSYTRVSIKKLYLRCIGKEQWMTIKKFDLEYKHVLKAIKEKLPNCKVITLSTVYIDDNFFPQSTVTFEEYNKVIKKLTILNEYKHINIYDLLKTRDFKEYYCEDNFHLNNKGYELISNILEKEIMKLNE